MWRNLFTNFFGIEKSVSITFFAINLVIGKEITSIDLKINY